jgi:hypothetical protein
VSAVVTHWGGGGEGSIIYTMLSLNKETQLAANMLSVLIIEHGEMYTAVLLTLINVADYHQ